MFGKLNKTASLKDKIAIHGKFNNNKPFKVYKNNGTTQSINMDDLKSKIGSDFGFQRPKSQVSGTKSTLQKLTSNHGLEARSSQ